MIKLAKLTKIQRNKYVIKFEKFTSIYEYNFSGSYQDGMHGTDSGTIIQLIE